ncbi:MAG: hypothetical protein CVU44_20285 [Chloroflexi bacterium HGW-Chloroflexi-6]|nr:MAG: hypothetical protein CVU44_20285 [Chloroflexi bacterium HGW-Chloroflexi-6]
MYNFNNMIPEKRSAWRSAYEIKIAAHEHEKRRFQMINEYASLATPRTKGAQQSGWTAIFKAPLRLLAFLIG